MQHGGELNAQLARRMDGDAELKRLADAGGLDAGANAAPEGGVEQNHIDGGIENIGGQLLEVDHHRVGGQRNADHLAHAAHAVQAVDGVFQIVVAQCLRWPGRSGWPVRWTRRRSGRSGRNRRESGGQGAVGFQLVIGMKDAALQFVGGESEALFQWRA